MRQALASNHEKNSLNISNEKQILFFKRLGIDWQGFFPSIFKFGRIFLVKQQFFALSHNHCTGNT